MDKRSPHNIVNNSNKDLQSALRSAAADARLLARTDLWDKGAPRQISGFFRAPLLIVNEPGGPQLNRTAFWTKIDEGGFPFRSCHRKDLDGVMVWKHRGGEVQTKTNWIREICVLKEHMPFSGEKETLIAVNQRKGRVIREKRKHVPEDAAASRSVQALDSLRRPLFVYEEWALTFECGHQMFGLGVTTTESRNPLWAPTWCTLESVDLWALPPVQRLEAIGKVTAILAEVTLFLEPEFLRTARTPHRVNCLLGAPFRVQELSPQRVAFSRQLAGELQARLLQRPATRLRLPKGFFNAKSSVEPVDFIHWSGVSYTGPLRNGVPHGWGRSRHGIPEIVAIKHEGEYVSGMPNGFGKAQIILYHKLAISYEGELHYGAFGRKGKVTWGDGSVYEGALGHPDWIYLTSRVSGRVYRISAVFAPVPRFELMPATFHPACTYHLGDGSGPKSLVHLLRAIESSEREGEPILQRPEVEEAPSEAEIERLPIEDALLAMLGC